MSGKGVTRKAVRSHGWAWFNPLLLVFDGHPEPLFQQGELTDEICDGVGEGLLQAIVHTGLHKADDLVLQQVGDFVAGKQHLWIHQQLWFDDVSSCVVFFVAREQTGIGHLSVLVNGDHLLASKEQKQLKSWRDIHPNATARPRLKVALYFILMHEYFLEYKALVTPDIVCVAQYPK